MPDELMIAVRLALYVVLAVTFGLAAFSLYGLKGAEREHAIALRLWLVGSAALGLLLSIAYLLLLASTMAGTPLWPIDRSTIDALLDTSIGAAWKVRMLSLFVAGGAALLARGRAPWLILVVAAAAISVGSLAWTGHGAMDDGPVGWLHLGADIVHLIAAAIWAGALLGLLLLVSGPIERADAAHLRLTHRALEGFGTIGTIVVGAVLVTGLINAWLLVGPGNVASLGTTLYGRLFVIKLVLFVGMLGFASLNRFRLTPVFAKSTAINEPRPTLGALRSSLALETSCVVVVLALVAWFGTLAPPTS